MPRYFVYDKEDGRVVHVHETYDVTSGTTLPCTQEEVLAVLDEGLEKERLGILQSEFEPDAGSGALRVDLTTQNVMAAGVPDK
ncbi:hypothetical protein GCM10010145_48020 [Streptomyces ruber]|uniref:Uncharacterized protein n=2 Tax=Streptomyces TaxID=1883 RepID=A0A918BJ27_9ACTN|nr:hypothetical protein [Streptomyces ruber]GGQ72717.1 hypothetical protein GCM10010145_48020 [Streptomyces ruber]